MTFFWLLIWLINETPDVEVSPRLNNWMIALIICMLLDVSGWVKGLTDR